MIDFFYNLNNVTQALIATIFTWQITSFGAATVFLFKKINKNVLDAMLGFSAGVMIAASFFSLIMPSIEMSKSLNMIPYVITSIGFMFGGILLFVGDKIFEKIHDKKEIKENSSIKRVLLLILSITLHNIPEGMAIGVSFGSIKYGLNGASVISSLVLALGIGIQNLPEGAAVSLPLLREGYSRKKAFFYGQLSGIVEPIASVIGAILVLKIRYLLPFLLSFAAGAMIYVVVQELIPESQTNKKKELMALFTLIGFTIMMVLDVALS